MAKFHILENDKWFYWHLKANNWNKICWSWELYTTKENALKWINFVKSFSKDAEIKDDTIKITLPSMLLKNKLPPKRLITRPIL